MTIDFEHGLVIGKFYPPHLGHRALIRYAASRCQHVSVVVMASRGESIPLEERVQWLEADAVDNESIQVVGIPCDIPIDLASDTIWTAHLALMRAAAATVSDAPIDAVVTGELYGAEMAVRLGAKHLPFERAEGSPSGTAVRADLAGRWDDLTSATQGGLATRVIFVGAESTGTTTLSRMLAEHYRAQGGVWERTRWVEEYGRDHTIAKWNRAKRLAELTGEPEPMLDDLVWRFSDFDEVARVQTRREYEALRNGSPLLVCDTDAFATAVWERRYLGRQSRSGQAWAHSPLLPRRDLYFVTDHVDVPWLDDGVREGDLKIRAAMTDWFIEALTRAGHSWVLLTGSLEERFELAVRCTDLLFEERMTFAEPLPMG